MNRLTFIRDLPKSGSNRKALYLCSCGNEREAYKNNVYSGKTRSCGCLNDQSRSERLRLLPTFGKGTPTHGMRKSQEYTVWRAMLNRCYREKNDNYKYYGGRGIAVCERWLVFKNFFEDMGEKPKGLTIERLNNELGYSPDNCVWADWKQQASNRRKSETE